MANQFVEQYAADLEVFLTRLRNEIESTMGQLTADKDDLTGLDEYICALNTFYYQSFNDHFMPCYRHQFEQLINEKLGLSRTEGMVKKDIMAIIKRYAGLCNRVKTITRQLTDWHHQVDSLRQLHSSNQRGETISWQVMLQQLQNSVTAAHNITEQTLAVLQDQELANALASSPAGSDMIRVLSGLDFHNLKTRGNVQRFGENLNHIALLTGELTYTACPDEILAEISQRLLKLDDSRIPELQNFYRRSLKITLEAYYELISLYLEQGNNKKVAATAHTISGWLAPVLSVLQRMQSVQASPFLLTSAATWPELSAEPISQLESRLEQLELQLPVILATISDSGQTDLQDLRKYITGLVNDNYNYFYNCALDTAAPGILLAPALNRICLDLYSLETRLDAVQEQQEHMHKLSYHYQTITSQLDKYLELLANTKSDLERLLAPRNLNRIWNDMDIRIDRLRLAQGEQFPVAYTYLLDKYRIESRISDRDLVVLQEEGDLFIIQVGDLVEEEVPYLVIGMKG